MSKLVDYISKTGGVSFDVGKNRIVEPVDYWMFPKYPSRTLIVPETADLFKIIGKYIEDNHSYLHEPDCFLGVWLNPEFREYYLDITTTVNDRNQAVKKARDISQTDGRQIVAIYNPLKKETVYLKD